MPAGGFAEYARLMMALPATANQIAARTGMGDGGVRRLLRKFWWLKLVHPGGKRQAGCRHPVEAVWMEGEGPAVQGLRLAAPLRASAQHIAWAVMWRALKDGATKLELQELSGVTGVSVRRAICALGSLVHVAEYERDALGRPFPVWKIGRKKSMQKPKPPTHAEKWRCYQARKRVRIIARMPVAVGCAA